ncbi:hypothetical protein XBKQ1_2150034 [Xenorhabdus bovienii str. kraussei Quebec]|uniref:Uncharacterized protein n=1 Tax=Xenorhabdus bovienii str. kraussei Quebec TaxID=1398203 RepID=A0A077PE77_XENBV|nr:hypothetical protein XBKQ1_2150034 [Xenorhabdus bovienii str. kraussei Quebec]
MNFCLISLIIILKINYKTLLIKGGQSISEYRVYFGGQDRTLPLH